MPVADYGKELVVGALSGALVFSSLFFYTPSVKADDSDKQLRICNDYMTGVNKIMIKTSGKTFPMFDKYNINLDDQVKLYEYAKSKDLILFSTPFDIESADFLNNELDVDCFKIASVDLVNIPLIEHVSKKLKPIIISTGMSKISEIDDAVETVKSTGNKDLVLLHCNSSYPSTYAEVNLKFMDTLKKMYNIPVGFSDHTTDLLSSKVAVSRGANVIERHFTLNKKMEGPDHILSSDKKEMKELIKFKKFFNKWELWKKTNYKNKKIKESVELLLGDGIKKIQPNEYITINSQKKSLYAKNKIRKGQIIKRRNLEVKGPAGGILPKYINIIIGRKAKKKILQDYPIQWENI